MENDATVYIIVRVKCKILDTPVLEYLGDCGWWYQYPLHALHFDGPYAQRAAELACPAGAHVQPFTLDEAAMSRHQAMINYTKATGR